MTDDLLYCPFLIKTLSKALSMVCAEIGRVTSAGVECVTMQVTNPSPSETGSTWARLESHDKFKRLQ